MSLTQPRPGLHSPAMVGEPISRDMIESTATSLLLTAVGLSLSLLLTSAGWTIPPQPSTVGR